MRVQTVKEWLESRTPQFIIRTRINKQIVSVERIIDGKYFQIDDEIVEEKGLEFHESLIPIDQWVYGTPPEFWCDIKEFMDDLVHVRIWINKSMPAGSDDDGLFWWTCPINNLESYLKSLDVTRLKEIYKEKYGN